MAWRHAPGGACAMESRELFAAFAPQWWDHVSIRAWSKTTAGLQVAVQPVAASIIVLVVAGGIDLVTGSLTKAALWDAIKNGTIWFGVFWTWYGVNVVRATREIHNEQEAKIATLEAA